MQKQVIHSFHLSKTKDNKWRGRGPTLETSFEASHDYLDFYKQGTIGRSSLSWKL